jgi:hypothetical protein
MRIQNTETRQFNVICKIVPASDKRLQRVDARMIDGTAQRAQVYSYTLDTDGNYRDAAKNLVTKHHAFPSRTEIAARVVSSDSRDGSVAVTVTVVSVVDA